MTFLSGQKYICSEQPMEEHGTITTLGNLLPPDNKDLFIQCLLPWQQAVKPVSVLRQMSTGGEQNLHSVTVKSSIAKNNPVNDSWGKDVGPEYSIQGAAGKTIRLNYFSRNRRTKIITLKRKIHHEKAIYIHRNVSIYHDSLLVMRLQDWELQSNPQT